MCFLSLNYYTSKNKQTISPKGKKNKTKTQNEKFLEGNLISSYMTAKQNNKTKQNTLLLLDDKGKENELILLYQRLVYLISFYLSLPIEEWVLPTFLRHSIGPHIAESMCSPTW